MRLTIYTAVLAVACVLVGVGNSQPPAPCTCLGTNPASCGVNGCGATCENNTEDCDCSDTCESCGQQCTNPAVAKTCGGTKSCWSDGCGEADDEIVCNGNACPDICKEEHPDNFYCLPSYNPPVICAWDRCEGGESCTLCFSACTQVAPEPFICGGVGGTCATHQLGCAGLGCDSACPTFCIIATQAPCGYRQNNPLDPCDCLPGNPPGECGDCDDPCFDADPECDWFVIGCIEGGCGEFDTCECDLVACFEDPNPAWDCGGDPDQCGCGCDAECELCSGSVCDGAACPEGECDEGGEAFCADFCGAECDCDPPGECTGMDCW